MHPKNTIKDVVEIPLTQGKVALIDASDYELVSPYKWIAWWNGWNWYAVTDKK